MHVHCVGKTDKTYQSARSDSKQGNSRAPAFRLQAPPRYFSAQFYGPVIEGASGIHASRLSRDRICDPIYARQPRALQMMRSQAFDVVSKTSGTFGILKCSLYCHCGPKVGRQGCKESCASLRRGATLYDTSRALSCHRRRLMGIEHVMLRPYESGEVSDER